MLLLNSASLTGFGLNRIFSFACDASFDGMELTYNSSDYDITDAEYLNSLNYKIPIVSMLVPESTLQNTQKALEIAKKTNIKFLVIDSPDLFDFKFKNFIKKYLTSKKTKIKILTKTLPRIGGRKLNICFDTANFAFSNQNIINVYNKFRENIFLIHLSNISEDNSYCMLNEGVIPLESFLTKITKLDNKTTISVKIDPFHLKCPDHEKIKENLRKIKMFVSKYTSKPAISNFSNYPRYSSTSAYSNSFSSPITESQKHSGGLGLGGKLPG